MDLVFKILIQEEMVNLGEDCGIITISNDLTVYAYGGKGGASGSGHTSCAPGGGGYPAAGIGGGGAGGGSATDCTASGGYCGALNNGNSVHNGLGGEGGGYYQGAIDSDDGPVSLFEYLGGVAAFGNSSGCSSPYVPEIDNHNSGYGGSGGNGRYYKGFTECKCICI